MSVPDLSNEKSKATVPLLAAWQIGKSFGGVEVLKGVDFEVNRCEVHALCGENGAGKSTLMNILAGVLQPDGGHLEANGRRVPHFSSAHQAQQQGVAIVFQERSLFGPLTVAENLYVARQPARLGLIQKSVLRERAARLLSEVAPDLDPADLIEDLSPAQQQMVEIAKALSFEASVIIFDEPTAALTEAEVSRLFAVIGRLRQRGAGIVYISHRLEEIFRVGDRVTVLKDGVKQGTRLTQQTKPEELIRLMVGRDLEPRQVTAAGGDAPVQLKVSDWTDPPARRGFKPLLENINFHIRQGEVVGFAGLAGAGRTELARSLFGARPRGAGKLSLQNQSLCPGCPADAIRDGLGYLSEDRKESGLFLEMSIARNIAAARVANSTALFWSVAQERAAAEKARGDLQIVSRSLDQEVSHLSGGNQQKVFLARWLLMNPKVLIADEPTRGVDVGAKAAIHELLYQFARRGAAVMVISSDLPEVLTVSDRIYVMRAGRIAGELSRAEASEETVMRLATANQVESMRGN